MTEFEEKTIWDLRADGKGYKAIAKKLNLPISTIKSYCLRNNVDGFKCKQCGKMLKQAPGKKQRKFCSDDCRIRWWNKHKKLVSHRFIKPKICEHCGESFLPIKRTSQKYCSRDCYLDHIRKGENDVRSE